jgi:lipid-A-disaccharide synthase
MALSEHYFIIAGEPSADNHGAALMHAMKKLNPNIKFQGIGGEKMEDVGLISMEPLSKMSVMGFVEILKHLAFFKALEKKIICTILNLRPKRVILIDYPGFNLRIASKLHGKNIPVTYYISPQVWAWKEKRIKFLQQYIDQLLVIFPFEKKWFKDRGIDAHFVGHPLLDEWTPSNKEELRNELGFDSSKPLLTLFPGSRAQEINRHLQICVDAGNLLKKQIPDLQIALGLVSGFNKQELVKTYNLNNINIIQGNSHKILESADCAIVASGTSTLEGAVFGIPMVIMYKMSSLSWYFSKKMVKVQFAGMVNIIADQEIVPECLQSDATSEKIASNLLPFFQDRSILDKTKNELLKVKIALGGKGASRRAAKHILGL